MTADPRVRSVAADVPPVDLALLLLLSMAVAVAGFGWTIAATATALTGHPPTVGLVDAGTALAQWAHHPSDPRLAYPRHDRHALPGGVGMYLAVLLDAATLVLAGRVAVRGASTVRGAGVARGDGYANRRDINAALSERAAARRGHRHGTDLRRQRATATVFLGVDIRTRTPLYGSAEDSYLYLGPPRAGKGVNLVIPQTLDAPGAALITATRPDTLRHTLAIRARRGPVAVFDPQQLAGDRVPRLRWAPQHGCADPLTAIIRGKALAAGARIGADGGDDAFWLGMTEAILRGYLHAADLIGASMRELQSWTFRPGDPTPIRILRTHPKAAAMWAEEIVAQAHTDPRQRDSAWMGVRRAMDALADPRVLDTCCPEMDAFDPRQFLADGGTLYLLGSPGTQMTVAPLVSALVEELVENARRLAATAPDGRLDPPLTLLLDEAANIAPIPSLPNLLADGGGSGITTICVLQSLAQARARWGSYGAEAMWDASTTKIVLGGLAGAEDLHRISQLAGDIDDNVPTHTTGAGGTSTSVSARRIPALPITKLRTLPDRHVIVLARRIPPVEAELRPWWRGPHAAAITRAMTTGALAVHRKPWTRPRVSRWRAT